jgi:hypothetical protein
MKSLISFFTLLVIKILSKVFYRFRTGWPEEDKIRWKDVKLIVFLNHTSLFEILYTGILPVSFIRLLSKHMVLPVAIKTIDRPIVGLFFKIFSPGSTPITRKRDDSWQEFLASIQPDSIIVIAPEGRMKRKNGLDARGNKMNVKPGVVDILATLTAGQMLFAYSGGLHHIQVPGEGWPRIFKTLKMDIETYDIPAYKNSFPGPAGSQKWKKLVLDDMQYRLETKPPTIDSSAN